MEQAAAQEVADGWAEGAVWPLPVWAFIAADAVEESEVDCAAAMGDSSSLSIITSAAV